MFSLASNIPHQTLSHENALSLATVISSQLSVGSIVNCNEVMKFNHFQQAVNERQGHLQQLEFAHKQVVMFDQKIRGTSNATLVQLFKHQKQSYGKLIENLQNQLKGELPEAPNFANLSVTSESPIDLEQSTVFYKQGYQSAHYHTLKDTGISNQSVTKSISFNNMVGQDQSNPSSSLVAQLARDIGTHCTHIILHQSSLEVQNQELYQAYVENGRIKSIKAAYDKDKLQQILNAMESQDEELQKSYGISQLGSEKAFAIIKDAELGGFFLGFKQESVRVDEINATNLDRSYSVKQISVGLQEDMNSRGLIERQQGRSIENKNPSSNLTIVSYGADGFQSNAIPAPQGTNIQHLFKEFVNTMASSPDAGIPVKFSFEIVTESMIRNILKK